MSPDSLWALVPVNDAVAQYTFQNNEWICTYQIQGISGTSCHYYDIGEPNLIQHHAVVLTGNEIIDLVFPQDYGQNCHPVDLPATISLNYGVDPALNDPRINPVSITSQPRELPGHCAVIDAIIFHRCFAHPGKDSWMILHWCLPLGSRDWFVADVILPRASRMPR